MPELSRFFGIIARMFYSDHEPAHFHAIYGEYEALIEIETLVVFRGSLPRWALALVLEWAAMPRVELHDDWQRARKGEPLNEIEPLDWSETMALLRIREVSAREGFELRLTLTDGSVIDRDGSRLLVGPVFERIRSDPALFGQVRAEGGTMVWPNGADLCPDVLIWGGPPPEEGRQPARPPRA